MLWTWSASNSEGADWQSVQVEMAVFTAQASPEADTLPGRQFRLTSESDVFGGFSAAAWLDQSLYLLSDRGTIWRAKAEFDQAGYLRSLEDWQWLHVREAGKRRTLDLEALTITSNGRMFATIEDRHRIYELIETANDYGVVALPTPDILKGSPENQGIEAMTSLDGRTFLALSEGLLRADGGHAGTAVDVTGMTHDFSYPTSTGFAPTDLQLDDDGQLYVLERRFGLLAGWQTKISRLAFDETGQALREPLIELGTGLNLDNFEGLAVRGDGANKRATIISDDNFLFVQSTLLFDLPLP